MLRSNTIKKSTLVNKIETSLLFCVLLFLSFNLTAQPINTIINDVVAPTPAAAAFGKYTDIPVNHATGVPDISVPIDVIQDGTLSLPISLRYHASGLKVSEVPSWVGAGWNLDIGGIISRSVQGRPDDGVLGFYYFGDELNTTSSSQIRDIVKGERDGEPDLFNYSIPGYTGKFHLEWINGNPEIVQYPKSDVKIEVTSFQGLMFRQFTVTDPSGTRYIFGYYNDGQGVNKLAREFAEVESENPTNSIASWFLVRIESFDNLFSIDFNYSVFDYAYDIKPSCTRAYYFTGGNCSGNSPDIQCPQPTNFLVDSYKLESITATNKTITFESVSSGDYLKLNKIKCTSGTFCKDFNLTYDNSIYGDRLTLKTMQEQSCNGSIIKPPHTFVYHSSPNVDRHSKAIDHWGFYNGATNNNVNSAFEMNIPTTFVPFGNTGSGYTEGGADRESDFTEMVKGTLESITYPTGGSTEFLFEANTYKTLLSDPPVQVFSISTDEPPNYDCITEITSSGQYTFSQQADIDNATFEMGLDPEDCINPDENEFNISIRVFKFISNAWVDIGFMEYNTETTTSTEITGDFTEILYSGTTTPGLFRFDLETIASPGDFKLKTTNTYDGNKEVGGLRIKKITTKDGITSNDIERSYEYHDPMAPQFSSGILLKEPLYGAGINGVSWIGENGAIENQSFAIFLEGGVVPLQTTEGFHLYYPNVIELINNGINGKTVFEFDVETIPGNNDFPQDLGQLAVKRAKLVESRELSSTDVEIQKTNITPVEPTYEGSNIYLKSLLADNFSCEFDDINGSYNLPGYIAAINQYQMYTGVYQILQKSVELDGVNTLTEYTYDSQDRYFSPETEQMTNSDGKVFQTKYTYPHDVPGSVYTALVDANRIDPVTTENYIDPQSTNTLVDGTKIEYENFSVNTGTFPYPKYHRRFEYTWGATNNPISNGWVLAGTINSIDPTTGKTNSFTIDGWLPESYTWTSDGLIDIKNYQGFTVDYDYYPGTRMISRITEIDGRYVDYSYDNLSRLNNITENCTNTSTDILYHYGSPSSGGNKIESTTIFPSSTNSALSTLSKISFFDGIGREIQIIKKNQGPLSNQDIITASQYDNRGFVVSEFESKAFSNNNGTYQNPNLYSTWKKTSMDYYKDPLGRIKSSTPPDWYATNFFYDSNNTSLGGHSANSLMKTTIVDGNGNKSIEYQDKRNRIVISQSTNNTETSVLTTETKYDDKDRIQLIIPPGSSQSTSTLNFSYLYYGNDLIQEKKVPDMAKVEYRYNRKDLPIHYQDGFLLNEGKWHAIQYDNYGRPTYEGFSTTPSVNNTTSNPTISASNRLSYSIYGSNAIDKDKIVMKETRVLNSDGTLGNYITNNFTYDNCGRVLTESKNNLLNLTPDSETLTFTYDAANNITFEDYQHSINGSTHFIDVTRTIDFAGRKDKVFHKFNGSTNKEISNIDYTEKNQIQRLYLGKTSSNYLQQLDFTYLNNRYLSKINNAGLTNNDLFYLELKYDQVTSGSNAISQYNGNISEVISQVKNEDRLIFGFRYDFNNRVTNAYSRNINSNGSLINYDKFTSSYTYDNRGNLGSINRKGQYAFNGIFTSGDIDLLTFAYGAGSNKLNTITDNAPTISRKYGAKDSGGSSYSYDSNGNITFDPTRGATISYNFLNLPRIVNLGNGKLIEWTYDSDGKLQRKKVLENADVLEDRYYIDQTEYKNGELVQVNHDHGRLVISDGCNQNHFLDGVLDQTKTYKGDHIISSTNLSSNSNIDFFSNTSVLMKDGFKVESGSQFIAQISPCNNTTWQYEYVIKDHLGNNRVMFSDVNGNGSINPATEILDETHYYPFGMSMMGEWNSKLKQDYAYQYNGKELISDHDLDWYNYGARYYDPAISRFISVDALADDPNQIDKSPYAYAWNNPVNLTDPDGNCPNCVTGGVGAVVGGLFGGGIELGKQLWKSGKVTSWKAVGGSALQGAITGGAAGFTGGASLLTTAAVAGTANAVGGTANRTIQGQETTAGDLVLDATIGAGLGAAGNAVGNVVKGAADDLSNAAKGKLGEAVTEIKYAAQGYKSQGKAVVPTGGKTPTGKVQVAKYDHNMENVITGKQLTVESKFNTSGFTGNQRAAAGNVTTSGGVIVDRTTSQGLGNTAKAATTGAGAGASAQKEREY